MKYLIKDKDMGVCFKQNGSVGVYGRDIGKAIHSELPHYLIDPKEYPGKTICQDDDIIRSDDPMFKKILIEEKRRLILSIQHEEYRIKNDKENLELIEEALKEI
jgi:hypothetical protein